jgi:hypothetical protein
MKAFTGLLIHLKRIIGRGLALSTYRIVVDGFNLAMNTASVNHVKKDIHLESAQSIRLLDI